MPITTEPSPSPPPAGVARARLIGNMGAYTWGVGYWLLLTGTPDGTDLGDLATDLYGAFETRLLPYASGAVHLRECQVRYYTGSGELTSSIFADHAGGGSGGEPVNCSIVVSWGIADSYRGGKPRTYLPPPGTGHRDTDGTWADGLVTSVTSDAASFISDVNGFTTTNITSVSLGTVHFFRAGAALTPPTFDPYLTASAQKRICTQRRRLGREIG